MTFITACIISRGEISRFHCHSAQQSPQMRRKISKLRASRIRSWYTHPIFGAPLFSALALHLTSALISPLPAALPP